MESLFFWSFSSAMIVFGLAVVLCRNPINSALCFAFTIFFMAALFVMLNAFFLAAVQVLVTAGAVMVLFLFIIMLLNISEVEHAPRQKIWMGCTTVLALGFVYLVARTLGGMPQGLATTDSLTVTPFQTQQEMSSPSVTNDDTHEIGHALLTKYVAPFEVTSLLILVATIGVIVLSKQDDPPRPSPLEDIAREAPPLKTKPEPALKT
jgi:NADH-quinone oxidoreductase subunit J